MNRSSEGSDSAKDVDQDQPSRKKGEGHKGGDSEQKEMSHQDQKQQLSSSGDNRHPSSYHPGLLLSQGHHPASPEPTQQLQPQTDEVNSHGHGHDQSLTDHEKLGLEDNHSALVSSQDNPPDKEAKALSTKQVHKGSSNLSGAHGTAHPKSQPKRQVTSSIVLVPRPDIEQQIPKSHPEKQDSPPSGSGGRCSCCSIL